MSAASREQTRRNLQRFGPVLLIGGLVAWHAFYNWLWLSQNVVLTGWDKARHLAQSLSYNSLLTPLTLRTFFDAIISDEVRPPLAPMSAVPLYRLFGTSGDVATWVNIGFLALTLVATWKLGLLLRDRWLGAVSVVLLALLPMFYAMSRYFYLEYPLMALVAITMWLLLASEGFQKRGTTLVFGVCLGLGLLTKRTYVAFVVAPIVLIALTSDVLPCLWQRLRGGLRVDWRGAVLAVLGALALAAVWLLPNWSTVRDLSLGAWLFPLWAGLVAITIYLLLRRPSPDTNFLSALSIGATLGSIWYLANVNFFQRMLLFAYGVNDPRGRTIGVTSLRTYTDYLAVLITQHVSLIITIILVVVALAVLAALLLKGRLTSGLRKLVRRRAVGWWVVVLWIVGPYLVLTLSIYHEARAITPVLPAVALLGGGLLLKLPSVLGHTRRTVTVVLLILLIVIGLVQFYALSFEPLHGLVDAVMIRMPVLGQTSLLGYGGYLQRPDAEATDHRYWIEPDVLARMEQTRQAEGWEAASLGLLVNAKQINFEHFAYLVQAEGYHPRLSVERLARAHGPEPVYPRLFNHDFLLVKRENAAADADSQAVIDQILDDPPHLFSSAFELNNSYALPDGDTVYLFQRRERPPDDITADTFPELAQILTAIGQDGDAVVVSPPSLVPLLGQNATDNLNDLQVYAWPGGQVPDEALAAIAADHNRLFVVLGEGDAGVSSEGLRWLNENAYRARDGWFGPTQLILYGLSNRDVPALVVPVGANLGGRMTLASYSVPEAAVQAGSVVPLTLTWQAGPPKDLGGIDADYKVFVHLVVDDAAREVQGPLIAQRDSEPAGGSRPTSSWVAGETITDRVGLLLPTDLSPGEYQLLVGMYDPATLERLVWLDAEGREVGDTLRLGRLHVSSD